MDRTKQLSLFPDKWPAEPVPPSHKAVQDPVKRKRLTGQNARVLERLRQGKATAVELGSNPELYGLNYKARVSDLRDAGYGVVQWDDEVDGTSWYRLTHEPE